MKPIVAPIDFSPGSENALNYAVDLAAALKTDLFIIHVAVPPLSYSEVPAPSYNFSDLIKEAENDLNRLRNELLARTGGKISIETELRQGGVIHEIGNYCKKLDPFAIVMGTETTNGLDRFLFGGKTISAIRQLSWPLIIIPPGVKFANIAKIGLACDLRTVEESTPVKELKELVQQFHAELHVLHVKKETGEMFEQSTIKGLGTLQELIADLKPQYHFIDKMKIEEGVQEFAKNNKLDLIIVVPKKHGFFDSLLQHSHSERLATHTPVPLMAIYE